MQRTRRRTIAQQQSTQPTGVVIDFAVFPSTWSENEKSPKYCRLATSKKVNQFGKTLHDVAS